jgi:hypothetical protein
VEWDAHPQVKAPGYANLLDAGIGDTFVSSGENKKTSGLDDVSIRY